MGQKYKCIILKTQSKSCANGKTLFPKYQLLILSCFTYQVYVSGTSAAKREHSDQLLKICKSNKQLCKVFGQVRLYLCNVIKAEIRWQH